MASFLYRLGALAYRRRWAVLGIWTVILLLIGVGAGAFMGKLSNTFTIPGTETQRTLDRLKVEMPELAGGTGSIVFRSKDGTALTQAQHRAITDSLGDLAVPVRGHRGPPALRTAEAARRRPTQARRGPGQAR